MKKILSAAALLLAAMAVAVPAHAGKGGPAPVTTITKKNRHDNKAFVGVQWNWGVRDGLTGIVGYRYASVRSNDRVRGGLLDLTMPLTGENRFTLGEIHLKGLAGSRSVQGEGGVVYGFAAGAFGVNGAVRGPYATAGTDYFFGKGWQPYVGVNSLGRTRGAAETKTTTCPSGYTYDSETNSCSFDGNTELTKNR